MTRYVVLISVVLISVVLIVFILRQRERQKIKIKKNKIIEIRNNNIETISHILSKSNIDILSNHPIKITHEMKGKGVQIRLDKVDIVISIYDASRLIMMEHKEDFIHVYIDDENSQSMITNFIQKYI